MWSDRYYYLNIYKDKNLSASCSIKKLRKYISEIPELKQDDLYNFRNIEPFPFTTLSFLHTDNINSWNSDDIDSEKTNLITIVCEKGKHVDFEELKRVFIQIASFLGWKLVDEETDDGIEGYIIWEPNEKSFYEQN
ncbi:MAG: hypothetical protein GY827_08045 [Cytophagales bacterium]|nr:hypothetical protein [Cytophagales bacterium]